MSTLLSSLPPTPPIPVIYASNTTAYDVFGPHPLNPQAISPPLRKLGMGAYGSVHLYRTPSPLLLLHSQPSQPQSQPSHPSRLTIPPPPSRPSASAVKSMALRYSTLDSSPPRRMITECKLLHTVSLHSPDIVAFHGAFLLPSPHCLQLHLCMEYMDLGSLATVAANWGPIPEAALADITVMLLRALKFLQFHSVMHRDLRPENILLNSDGRAKLADLGHAKATTSSSNTPSTSAPSTPSSSSARIPGMADSLGDVGDFAFTQTFSASAHSVIGNKLYMAPERLDVRRRAAGASLQFYDEKCDIWSLGLVLRVSAMPSGTGYPYPTTGMESLLDLATLIMDAPAPIMPRSKRLSRAFCDFVDSCMKKDPVSRPSATDLLGFEFMQDAVEENGSRLSRWITACLRKDFASPSARGGLYTPRANDPDYEFSPRIPWNDEFAPLLFSPLSSPAPGSPAHSSPSISRDVSLDDIAVLARDPSQSALAHALTHASRSPRSPPSTTTTTTTTTTTNTRLSLLSLAGTGDVESRENKPRSETVFRLHLQTQGGQEGRVDGRGMRGQRQILVQLGEETEDVGPDD